MIIYRNLDRFQTTYVYNFNKVILNKIQSCLEIEFEKYYEENLNAFSKQITAYGRITQFLNIYTRIYDKLNKQDTFSQNRNDKESESDDSGSDFQSSEEPKKN